MGNKSRLTLTEKEKHVVEKERGEKLPDNDRNRYRLAPHEVEAVLIHRRNQSSPAEKRKRLYFDIETSPNVTLTWRTGYKLNIPHDNIMEERAIICICYKWEGSDEVY